MSTFEEIRELVASKLSLPPSSVTLESNFTDDLNADSLDLADLVMAIEDKYGLDLAGEDTSKFKTVGDVVSAVEEMKS